MPGTDLVTGDTALMDFCSRVGETQPNQSYGTGTPTPVKLGSKKIICTV
jgi:hypothetical protein